MISINEYATDHQVTYEAVRRQVVRYEKELAGHVITQGKKKYLDDFAVQFLDGKRKGNPIAVRHEVEKDESDMMKAQMDALKILAGNPAATAGVSRFSVRQRSSRLIL